MVFDLAQCYLPLTCVCSLMCILIHTCFSIRSATVNYLCVSRANVHVQSVIIAFLTVQSRQVYHSVTVFVCGISKAEQTKHW